MFYLPFIIFNYFKILKLSYTYRKLHKLVQNFHILFNQIPTLLTLNICFICLVIFQPFGNQLAIYPLYLSGTHKYFKYVFSKTNGIQEININIISYIESTDIIQILLVAPIMSFITQGKHFSFWCRI